MDNNKNERLVQKYHKHTHNKDSKYFIGEDYINYILADIGELFAKDIAHDLPYNITDLFQHVAWTIRDLTIDQKIYLIFRLGEQFGKGPEHFEEYIMIPFLDRVEKMDS